jgi:ribulose-5-phosphate 4-epimerase/fuculose-1-phosphate aldolase
MDRGEIFEKIRAVGRAALTVDIENTHSGNIAVRFEENGEERLAITATGSPKGDLTPDKVCYPSLAETDFGYFKSSSETDIHALILRIPGISASMHGHTKTATAVTMDDEPRPKENPRAPFLPVDPLGVRYLYEVPVDHFMVASGSREMAETIKKRLENHPVTMIQEHGAFARGKTLEEALFHLCVTESSAETIFFAEQLGLDLGPVREMAAKTRSLLLNDLPDYSAELDRRVDFDDEPDTVEMFRRIGFRIFESRLSPFHTGSLSMRAASTMLYCPKAAQPRDLPGPLLEIPLDIKGQSESESISRDQRLSLHRAIFQKTPFKSIAHSHPSEVEAEILFSPHTGGETSRIIPIDVEGGFLYPAIPVLPGRPDPDDLCRALLDYHMAAVEGSGVWAAGEQSLWEAVRHIASAKDICRYRLLARLRGLDLSAMEPARSRSW